MTPLPFQDAWHAIPFWLAFGVWLVLEISRSRKCRSALSGRDDRGSYAVIVAGINLAMVLAFVIALSVAPTAFATHRESLYTVGLVLICAGIAFRAYAVRVLGRSFTFDVATRANQSVCEAGPYRYIRHPSYTGTFVTIFGVGLALGNWLSLIAALSIAAAAHAYRVAVEEKVLCRDLGAPYVAYMQRTRRFVPFLF